MRRAMNRMMGLLACGVVCGAAASFAHAQTVITQWSFNSVPPDGVADTGTFGPSVGTGAAACYNVAPSSPLAECIFASGNGSSDPAATDDSGWQTRGYQGQGTGPGTVGVEFSVSTANYTSIQISWDQRHSNTSSRAVGLFYSLDGVSYTQHPTVFFADAGDTWYNARTVDLSTIPGAGNNPNFKFRISPVFDPGAAPNTYMSANPTSTYAATGTHRFDMVTVTGTAVTSIPPTGVATASPGAVCAGGGQVVFSIAVTPGQNPVSSGITVNANLSSVGGGSAAALLDNGVAPDATAGDNIFTLAYTVPGSVTVGQKTIPIAVSDGQARTTSTNAVFGVADCTASSTSRVVISQVYGGGGNEGPLIGVFNADFIEIYNRSASSVDLTGWTVQYASAASAGGFDNPADRVQLAGVIRPGQKMLVQFSPIGAVGQPLPTPDFVGTGGIGNNAGRAAIVRGTGLIGTNCTDSLVEDLVGWGGALCFEGAAPAGQTANDQGVARKLGGAQDSNQSFNDFTVGTPSPSNRATGGYLAGCGSTDAQIVCAGSPVNFNVNVSAATGPASTGIQVRANLTSIGGGSNVALTDGGAGVFTLAYPIPSNVAQGGVSIPVTVSDAQGRTDSSAITLTIGACANSASRVVVAGIYGGGGNAGSIWSADHIEIFNRSASAVDLSGWSVQYADADVAGGFIASRTIPLSGSIGPGEYRLIQASAPGANGNQIPTPDFTPAVFFGMDNAAGRVAVVRVTTALGSNCGSSDIEDLVGYGPDAICQEGVATTAEITNSTGAYRKLNGCQDFNQNGIDFEVGQPLQAPRNAAAPVNTCTVATTVVCCRGTTCVVVASSGDCTAPALPIVGAAVSPASSCGVVNNANTGCCFADFTKSGGVNIDDIFVYLNAWFASSPYTDMGGNGSGAPNIDDIFIYLNAWFAGC